MLESFLKSIDPILRKAEPPSGPYSTRAKKTNNKVPRLLRPLLSGPVSYVRFPSSAKLLFPVYILSNHVDLSVFDQPEARTTLWNMLEEQTFVVRLSKLTHLLFHSKKTSAPCWLLDAGSVVIGVAAGPTIWTSTVPHAKDSPIRCTAYITSNVDQKDDVRADFEIFFRFMATLPLPTGNVARALYLGESKSTSFISDDIFSESLLKACLGQPDWEGGFLYLMRFQPATEQWNALQTIPFQLLYMFKVTVPWTVVLNAQALSLEMYMTKTDKREHGCMEGRTTPSVWVNHSCVNLETTKQVDDFLHLWLPVTCTLNFKQLTISEEGWKHFWLHVWNPPLKPDGMDICTIFTFQGGMVGQESLLHHRHMALVRAGALESNTLIEWQHTEGTLIVRRVQPEEPSTSRPKVVETISPPETTHVQVDEIVLPPETRNGSATPLTVSDPQSEEDGLATIAVWSLPKKTFVPFGKFGKGFGCVFNWCGQDEDDDASSAAQD
jgi:hypothetical protein